MRRETYHHGDLKNALVQTGIEILSGEGLSALSLRQVANRAGVSHSAPYAHFEDKQALIAAIAAEGFQRLYDRLETASTTHAADPPRRLLALSEAYLAFAIEYPALFKLMFSGALERETDYTDFVRLSRQNFDFLVQQVRICQQAGVLRPGPQDTLAVGLWSLVHGFVDLLLEGQISHHTLDRYPPRVLLCRILNQITLVELAPESEAGQ